MNNFESFTRFALDKKSQQQVCGGTATPKYPNVTTTSGGGTLISSVNTWTTAGTALPRFYHS